MKRECTHEQVVNGMLERAQTSYARRVPAFWMPKLKVVLIEGTIETEVNTKHSAMKALNPLNSTGLYATFVSDEVSPAGNKRGVSALATVAVGSVVVTAPA